VNGAIVAPAPEVKLLGVIIDQALRFKSHIGKAAKKGMEAVLALRRLHGFTSFGSSPAIHLHGGIED
jgi:hypothetical protein